MKYYSETDVKEMIDYAIAYGTDITNYCPSLDDYPSIEIKEPHGRLIDADALKRRMIELLNHGYSFDFIGCFGLIDQVPTILEASK